MYGKVTGCLRMNPALISRMGGGFVQDASQECHVVRLRHDPPGRTCARPNENHGWCRGRFAGRKQIIPYNVKAAARSNVKSDIQKDENLGNKVTSVRYHVGRPLSGYASRAQPMAINWLNGVE